MQAEVGDRLVLHGQRGTRIGVVTEVNDTGWVVRWADGDAPDARATWDAAKARLAVDWRRGVTAGVGLEASLRQQKLAREAAAKEAAAEQEPIHRPAAGE